MDEQARAFIPLIRAAGDGSLNEEQWSSCDGLVARLILLDQLSRNAFRGTVEAFAYDTAAVAVASQLIEMTIAQPHELPAPAAMFVSTCLMHTEDLAQHDKAAAFLEAHVRSSGAPSLTKQLSDDLPSHTAVLRLFGRYPHRNELLGRESTADELAWLASKDCPGWAKSQKGAAASGY